MAYLKDQLQLIWWNTVRLSGKVFSGWGEPLSPLPVAKYVLKILSGGTPATDLANHQNKVKIYC